MTSCTTCVMLSLLEVPRLPLPSFVPRAALARNYPDPADSFSPPIPLTYASSLSSLSPVLSQSSPVPSS